MAINIFHVQDYRGYLTQVLGERCARNAQYSLRAFARDLRTAPSFLSLIFNRKSNLSLSKAEVIADHLALEGIEREYFLALVQKESAGNDEQVLFLRQKHAFAILQQEQDLDPNMSLQDFARYLKISLLGRVHLKNAAEEFGLPPNELARICSRLKEQGWVEGSEEIGWSALKGLTRIESFDASESRRIFHQKVLQLAGELLYSADMSERHFFSTVFSLHHRDYRELCQVIEGFCRVRTDAYTSRDQHNRIYSMGLQILPVESLQRAIASSR